MPIARSQLNLSSCIFALSRFNITADAIAKPFLFQKKKASKNVAVRVHLKEWQHILGGNVSFNPFNSNNPFQWRNVSSSTESPSTASNSIIVVLQYHSYRLYIRSSPRVKRRIPASSRKWTALPLVSTNSTHQQVPIGNPSQLYEMPTN